MDFDDSKVMIRVVREDDAMVPEEFDEGKWVLLQDDRLTFEAYEAALLQLTARP